MTQNPAPEMPVNMNYENHIMYNNLIPFIFHYNVRTNRTAMYGNWHDNVEILCFVEGSGTVTYDLSNITGSEAMRFFSAIAGAFFQTSAVSRNKAPHCGFRASGLSDGALSEQ